MRKALSAKKIRPQAERILKDCNVTAPPVPVNRIAEMLGASIRYSPFEGESNELAGMLVRGNDQVVIGVNSLHHRNRQRFTIAHECGHLLLHEGGEVYIDRSFRVNKRDRVSSQAVNTEEIEANRFAAELLMPFDMVMKDLQDHDIDLEGGEGEELKALADKYHVSVQAMTFRMTNLLEDDL